MPGDDRPSIGDLERGLATTSTTAPSRDQIASAREAARPRPPAPESRRRALRRIEEIARITFGEGGRVRVRRISSPGPADPGFAEVLREFYRPDIDPVLYRSMKPGEDFATYRQEVLEPLAAEIGRRYDEDLTVFVAEVQEQGWLWLLGALNANLRELQVLRFEMLDPKTISEVHRGAARALALRTRELGRSAHGTALTDPLGRPTREARALEAAAVTDVALPALEILYTVPQRTRLLGELARGEEAARAAIVDLFDEAIAGIDEFGDELTDHRDHAWRYAPIVTAAVPRVISRPEDREQIRQVLTFALNLAIDLGGPSFGLDTFVAGTATAAAGLIWNPVGWAAVALSLLDLAVTGMGAYRTYRRERENDLARAASLFQQGQPLTDRASSYGPVLLDLAGSLLTAVVVVKGARASRGVAEVADARAVERSAAARGVDESLPEARPIEDVLERNNAPAERLAVSPEMRERVVSVGGDRPPAERTRTQTPLKSLGYEKTNPRWRTASARPPLETVEDFLRSITALGRHPPVPLNEAERAIFRLVGLERWGPVLRYAESNVSAANAVFKLKGKIQEILIDLLPQYPGILAQSLERARALGIQPRSVRLVTGLSERSRELVDAAIVGIRSDPVQGDRAIILDIFESKGRDNIADLVSDAQGPGQFALDFERFGRDPVTIGARTFEPAQIDVGEFTVCHALLPQGRSLNAEQVASILGDVPRLNQLQSPVRDEVLQGIAAQILRRLRSQ